MKKVQILMSTYNGENYVREQIDSLLKQDYQEVEILIRDDGSKDGTVSILDEYSRQYQQITIVKGANKGVIASFFELVALADEAAGFYAFCDQDDVWKQEKVSRAVSLLEKENPAVPLLYFSRLDLVDENLHFLKKSQIPPAGPGFDNALIQNIATGCTIVINNAMLQLCKAHMPDEKKVTMHDGWFYLLGTALGKVIYDDQSFLLYRQHSSNVLGMANSKWKSAKIRYHNFKKMGKNKPYTLQAEEFYRLFQDDLKKEQKQIVFDFLNKRRSFLQRIGYALKTPLYRQNNRDTILFKLLYTLNSY
ncbi:glycosyltransferase family 2 protein [Bacillaceae bacterium Marseille-Q3522]|nr:glycosyltransferase family 2 protein [Bacillaceae bacterium Marseille-Q3522]